jgi:hypothetical protein
MRRQLLERKWEISEELRRRTHSSSVENPLWWKLSEGFLFGCVVECAIMSVGCSRFFVMLVSLALVAITLASGG